MLTKSIAADSQIASGPACTGRPNAATAQPITLPVVMTPTGNTVAAHHSVREISRRETGSTCTSIGARFFAPNRPTMVAIAIDTAIAPCTNIVESITAMNHAIAVSVPSDASTRRCRRT